MADVPAQASLTPRFCFNQTALRDFLRLSRSTIDDSITQQLNALVTPGTSSRFDPRSTSTMAARARHPIAREACAQFTRQVLFPAWQSRGDVLDYCAGVATSPDPEDPAQGLRQEQDARARERVVDERRDPYSARYFPADTRTEELAALVRTERAVERIVRARTWKVLGERCADGAPAEVERALEEWRCRR